MSEERAERGAGAAARASDRGAPHPQQVEPEEIAVDLDEPEQGEPNAQGKPEPSPSSPSSERPKGSEGGPNSRRGRNRMTLRIPDDEVLRPSSPPTQASPDTPPQPAVSGTVPAARVADLPSDHASAANPFLDPHASWPTAQPAAAPAAPDESRSAYTRPPSSAYTRPSAAPSPPPAKAADVATAESTDPSADEEPLPPDPPTVRLPSSPDTSLELGDISQGDVKEGSRGKAGETLRGLPAVTAKQADEIAAVAPESPDGLAATSMRLPVATLPYAEPLHDGSLAEGSGGSGGAPLAHGVQGVAQPATVVLNKPGKPADLPPRGPRQSSIEIPVDEDLAEAVVSESAPPLDLDLERLSSRPSPAEPSAEPIQMPPPLPAPKVDLAPGAPGVAPPKSVPGMKAAATVALPPSGAQPPSSPRTGEPPAWLAAARPPALALVAVEEEARDVSITDAAEEEVAPISSSRPSEPGDAHEVSPEDVVSVESVRDGGQLRAPPPAPVPTLPRVPVALAVPVSQASQAAASPAPVSSPAVTSQRAAIAPPAVPPLPAGRPPVAVVQPVASASPIAPPPMNEGAAAVARRRVRPWWEELFNDDFIRTMARITDEQISMEADFIEDSLGVAKGAMVLDLACGTGRHAIELTRRGYQVVGFDLSLAMLARAADEAQDRNQKLNFVQGDMREMTFEETFDGVYCWSTSFGFFEEEKNAQVVTNVRRALKKGGQFLLDVANRDFMARQAPSVAWFEGDGCVCMDEMNIDWITSRMRVKRTMMMDDGRTKETEYSIRIYSLHELGKLLHDSGFRVADVSGRTATPGVFLGADSPRTLILAEKR